MLKIHPQVSQALENQKAVVALESTVIAHGLPYPENLETAAKMEEIIRENGATPATIAIIDGSVCVGLDKSQLERLTQPDIAKTSLKDISLLIAERGSGATTVAATMWAAHQAGIKIFVTGGIGGVHPGEGMDLSGDLPALATIPVAVVCSGPKSILDLPRTREWLETWGVPILGYDTDVLPAFYTRKTKIAVDRCVHHHKDAARYVDIHLSLKRGGILVTVPVPAEQEISEQEFQKLYQEAHKQAQLQNIQGSKITPFLMEFLRKASAGATLTANLALLMNNAKIGAQLATSLTA